MSAIESLQLACPDCLARIRVPTARLADDPRCPRCRTALLRPTPVELDDASFERYVGVTELPVLVDVWAPWCAPCRQYAPIVAQAAQRLQGRVVVAKVDSDRATATATAHRFGVRSIPTTLLLRHGREVDRLAGAVPLESLLRFVNERL